MLQSTTTSKLNKELAAAQLKFEALKKDSTGQEGNLKFQYVQLPDVLNMVRPLLNERGIYLSQPIEKGDDGVLRLTTRIQLEDEFMQSDGIPLPATSPGKELGKIITYARRIDLMPFLGIVGEEDEDAPDLKPTPALKTQQWKTVNSPAQVTKHTQDVVKTPSTELLKATSFPHGANELAPDARETAVAMENFKPLSETRNTEIQARLQDLVKSKVMDRRKLSLFLDKQHGGKKAFDVQADQWETTMKKIEDAVTAGDASVKTLLKGD